MSRWAAEPVGLGVSEREIALVGAGATVTKVPAPADAAAATPAAWSARLLELLGARGTVGPVHATLAPGLVRWWVVEPPEGTASLQDLQMYAAMRFEDLFDGPAAGWSISGDWRAVGATLCAAVPAGLAEALQSLARQAGTRRWSQAASTDRSCAAASARLPATGLWVWAELVDGHATLWWHREGRVDRATSFHVDRGEPWPRVVQELVRAGGVSSVGEIQEVHWTSAGPTSDPPADSRWRWHGHPLKTAMRTEDGAAAWAAASGLLR